MNKYGLIILLVFISCNRNVDNELKKMDCDDFSQKVAIRDSLSASAGVIVSNLKKIIDINADMKNKLIASYSADFKNNIAYSPSFCKTFNTYLIY